MECNEKWKQTCRICSEERITGIAIFSDKGKELFLQAKIRKYLYITVTVDDKFPKMLCKNCCVKLAGIHRFATTALKTQDTFLKLFSNTKSDENSEFSSNENRGLLHSYLTKGKIEKCSLENEVTEMEVHIDPMTILQYMNDDDFTDNINEIGDNDGNGDVEKEYDDNETIISSSSYNDNTSEDGNNDILHNCHICLQSFTTETGLQKHVWAHFTSSALKERATFPIENSKDENMNFKCNICSESFISEVLLENHICVHLTTQGLNKYLNGKICLNNENDSTLTLNTKKLTYQLENSSEEKNENVKPYNCKMCPRGFTSQFALQSHVWTHLSQDQNVNKYSGLEWELNDAVEKYSCPMCSKQISTKGNLKVHLETHRPKGKYGCDICGRIFKTQSNLYRHKEYHGGAQFPCTVCGRVYPTNSTLRAHSITHSNLRPHKCPLCDKTFKRNQDLKFHINQHTGARPYQCPYCPKAFASSGNCFSHRKRMHPQEVERDREKAAEIMR